MVTVTEQVRYLPCLVCDDFMVRRNYAMKSGIIIDVCRLHGVWLDDGEARRVIEFIEKHGMAHPSPR
jgi:Zn-finger nucleic acid-binding protein